MFGKQETERDREQIITMVNHTSPSVSHSLTKPLVIIMTTREVMSPHSMQIHCHVTFPVIRWDRWCSPGWQPHLRIVVVCYCFWEWVAFSELWRRLCLWLHTGYIQIAELWMYTCLFIYLYICQSCDIVLWALKQYLYSSTLLTLRVYRNCNWWIEPITTSGWNNFTVFYGYIFRREGLHQEILERWPQGFLWQLVISQPVSFYNYSSTLNKYLLNNTRRSQKQRRQFWGNIELFLKLTSGKDNATSLPHLCMSLGHTGVVHLISWTESLISTWIPCPHTWSTYKPGTGTATHILLLSTVTDSNTAIFASSSTRRPREMMLTPQQQHPAAGASGSRSPKQTIKAEYSWVLGPSLKGNRCKLLTVISGKFGSKVWA